LLWSLFVCLVVKWSLFVWLWSDCLFVCLVVWLWSEVCLFCLFNKQTNKLTNKTSRRKTKKEIIYQTQNWWRWTDHSVVPESQNQDPGG
jgi:hypothetical protein